LLRDLLAFTLVDNALFQHMPCLVDRASMCAAGAYYHAVSFSNVGGRALGRGVSSVACGWFGPTYASHMVA
jgi:hypothetical protein